MKFNLFLFFIFTTVLCAYAQNFIEYESFGFNTIESNVFTGGMYDTAEKYFYMINNPTYSVMRLCNLRIKSALPNDVIAWIFKSDQYELQEEYYQYRDDGTGYFLRQWYDSAGNGRVFNWNRYQEKFVDTGYEGPMGVGIRYITDKNRKLTAVELTGAYGENKYLSKNVNYNRDGSISVTFEDPIDHIYIRFYNIPKEKMTEIYLSAFTQDIRRHIYSIGEDSLKNRTKEELAIIRNCLYARYNYSFQTARWRDFMLKYYDPNYTGTYSNQEVMDRFSESDRLLLELILKYEKN